MKSRFITLALMALFLVSMVSALVIFTPSDLTATGEAGQPVDITFNIENTYATDLTEISAVFSDLVKGTDTIVESNLVLDLSTLTIATTADEDVTLSITIPSSQEAGVYTGTVEIWGTLTTTPILIETLNITLTVTALPVEEITEIEACNLVGEGSLKVDIKDINVLGENSFGDDDDYWYLFDEIEVEVEIENTNNNEKIKDIEVEWGIWSDDLNDWVIELDKEDEIDIKKDDEEIITFTFNLDDKDLDFDLDELDGVSDLTLVVVANGQEQEDPEFDVCASDSNTVELRTDEDFVIVTNIEMAENAACGDEIMVTAELWNIGDSDQEDVTVRIYNADLKLDKTFDIGDIDAFEDEEISFTFSIPQDAIVTSYPIEFMVYEDGDFFENEEDDESITSVRLIVSGSCTVEQDITITASLESEAIAGEELAVKATITNNGASSTDYQVLATNFNSWAKLEKTNPETFTLNTGESIDVAIVLIPNTDASGEQEFNLQILSNGQVTEQKISVSLQEGGSNFLSGITGSAIGGSTVATALIVAIVILVILIIIVAVSLARRSEDIE